MGFSLGGQAGDIGLTDPDPGSVSANRTFFKKFEEQKLCCVHHEFFFL